MDRATSPPVTPGLSAASPRAPLLTCAAVAFASVLALGSPHRAAAATYYVRQTVGSDANDGKTPATAWQSLAKLGRSMAPGDTGYVGPGLYRESVLISAGGRPDARITLLADPSGQHTGDPPGVVMLAGAEPVDEGIFTPSSTPGVFSAPLPAFRVRGVVEMEGDQYRYLRVTTTKEFHVDKMAPLDIVARRPSSYHYDDETKVLHLHTSDGRHPREHELELIRRESGIGVVGGQWVTIEGFTFRHMGDAGIGFFDGAQDALVVGNTSYGSRQGVRVYGARGVTLYGNTLFRNENSGVYFAAASASGSAIANTAYENVKGLRWGSGSVAGLAVDNWLFDNLERGLSIEDTAGVLALRNRLVSNRVSQLMAFRAELDSRDNCFANGTPDQLAADFYAGESYRTLAEMQKAKRQDLRSREGDCGPPPKKVDVRKLHAQTSSYPECARRVLAGAAGSCDGSGAAPPVAQPSPPASGPGTTAVPGPTPSERSR